MIPWLIRTSSAGCSAPRTPRRSSSGWASAPDAYLQLDDVVALERVAARAASRCASTASCRQVRARHEGARFDSDVFLIADGVLPAEVSEAAQVPATRFEPEVFVPPLPGAARSRKATGDAPRPGPVLRPDEAAAARRPVPRRRAALPQPRVPRRHPRRPRQHQRHLAASPPRPATPPSCSTPCSTRACSAPRPSTPRRSIFNVKGEDLLFLDHPNTQLDRRPADRYAPLGLPPGAVRVASASSPRRAGATANAAPDVASRTTGVTSLLLDASRSSAASELLPFLFADAEDDRQQYTMVVHNVAARLDERRAAGRRRRRAASTGDAVRTFRELVDLIIEPRSTDDDADRVGRPGHRHRARQRLRPPAARRRRPRRAPRAGRRRPTRRPPRRLRPAQVTVVDIHNLNDRAKRFVVGVMLRKAFEEKERSGPGPPAAVRRARRAQQVRPPRGLEPDQGDPARRRRAGPLARHHPHRRPADGERGRAPRRRQLAPSGSSAGSTPPRRPRRVRLPARRRSASGPRSSSRARCS